MTTHHLDDSVTQPYWDRAVEPRLVIAPGDTVVFDCAEPTAQVSPDTTAGALAELDTTLIHALNGSVFVDGAEPGMTLQVDILDMQHKGWGWSGIIPGLGLLSDDFPDPYIHHWTLDGDRCVFGVGDIALPYRPMAGCVGVAPAEPGRISTHPPRANAGNVDIRDLTTGTRIWLPVLAPGALFATGDCHASQGQGEVCGTAIECPMTVTMRFELREDFPVKELQYQTAPQPAAAGRAYHCTSAHGPDLHENARNAIRHMIDWLCAHRGLSANQAYVLCSAAADLTISEIVNVPNWVVSARLPLDIFEG